MSKTIDDLLTVASAGLTHAKFALGFAKRSGSAEGIEHAKGASAALSEICGGLASMGARSLDLQEDPGANPLAELARIEAAKPEALRLLESLRTAHQLAEQLHQVNPGSRWLEEIEELIAGIELEALGPSEAVTRSRE